MNILKLSELNVSKEMRKNYDEEEKKTTMKDKKKLCKRNSYSLFVTVKIIKFGNANIRLICTNNATHRCIEN